MAAWSVTERDRVLDDANKNPGRARLGPPNRRRVVCGACWMILEPGDGRLVRFAAIEWRGVFLCVKCQPKR